LTGGEGLNGSFLTKKIVEDSNNKIILMNDFSVGFRSNLLSSIDKIEIRQDNLESEPFCKEAFISCDNVYHLVSRDFGIGYSLEN